MIKKIIALFMVFTVSMMLVACSADDHDDIIVTMYPQYDFASQIVKDKMPVRLLTPPGVEPHAYEATSKDMVAIRHAKLFIFTSLEIDTWITDVSTLVGSDTLVLDLSMNYALKEHEHDNDHTHDEEHTYDQNYIDQTKNLSSHDHDDHDHDDIHFWTDPTTALQMIDAILAKIIEIDPNNATFYEANAQAYKTTLHNLHIEIDQFFQDPHLSDTTIYFAGHNALGAFGLRYHIHIVSLFPDFKPDQDLTSSQLTQFIQAIKNAEVKYLFIEELVEPKAAQTIVNELLKEGYALILLELHGYHNVTKEQFIEGISYIDLLQSNFDHLKLALSDAQYHD